MRFFVFIVTSALAAAPTDLCTQLCDRDGPVVCTGGFWTKPDGTCQAYLYLGDPSNREFCYHTSACASSCPSSGHPVRAADVPRLFGPSASADASGDRLASLMEVVRAGEPEALCASIREIPNMVRGAVAGFAGAALPPAAYWDRIRGSRFLAMPTYTSSCQAELIKQALVLAGSLAAPADEVSDFCVQHATAIRRLFERDHSFQAGIGEFSQIRVETVRVCPSLVDTEAHTGALNAWISGLRFRFPRVNPIQLSVSRAQTWTDSLGFLNGAREGFMSGLPRVFFIGERGCDEGGLGRDWLSAITRLAFSAGSTDPAGGLFSTRPVTDFVDINMAKPFTSATRSNYHAIGRLLALSVIQRLPLGVPLPRMFFSRLLDLPVTLGDVLQDDPIMHQGLVTVHRDGEVSIRAALMLQDHEPAPSPDAYVAACLSELDTADMDARMAVIREGFSSVLPVASVREFVSADDLRSIVFGAPEISVDDLMAHTTYDARYFTAASPQIQWMWAWLRRADNEVRRDFLRFVTGLSQLPVEGMTGLRYPIHITWSSRADLGPRSHTCSFGLDVPLYRDAAQLEEYMGVAIASDGFGMANTTGLKFCIVCITLRALLVLSCAHTRCDSSLSP